MAWQLSVRCDNNWNISLEPSSLIENLDAGDSIEINITLFVPKDTDSKKDNLTLKIVSEKGNISETIIISSNIIGPNIFEDLYNYFDSISNFHLWLLVT